MKYHTYNILAASVALLFATTPIAYASMTVGASSGVQMETTAAPMQVNVGGTVQGNAGAAPKVTLTPVQMKALMQAQAEAERKEGGTKMETGASGEEDDDRATGTLRAKEVASEEGVEGIENAELHIDLEEREDGEVTDETSTEAEIDMHEKVHSAHEFERFVHFKAKADKHLRSVGMKDGKVDVDYEESAKLFGFVKTTLNARVSADAAGNVTVAYPWYHIFMKKTHSSASLQSAIARAIAGERKGEREGIASTTMQATIATSLGIPNIFEIIANTLKDVSVKSETEASVAQ